MELTITALQAAAWFACISIAVAHTRWYALSQISIAMEYQEHYILVNPILREA